MLGTSAFGIPDGNYWMNNVDASNCVEKSLCYEVVNNTVMNLVCSGAVEELNYDNYPVCNSTHECSVICQSKKDIYG